MKNIKDLIDSKKGGIKKTASCAYFCQKADQLIKELIDEEKDSEKLKVKKIQGKTLFVEISNPSLAQRVKMKEEEILNKLKEMKNNPQVKRISYKVALKDH